MSISKIHLHKLLKILFLDSKGLRSALRTDIREEMAKEEGMNSSGGDFYGPFWSDAKDHVFALSDLHTQTAVRIAANNRRANLYPLLRDGFLLWWNKRRRWTNEPFTLGRSLKAQVPFPELDAIVKIDSILSVRDGLGGEHLIYPYFSRDPVLSDQADRLGLWALLKAFPRIPSEEFRILDLFRGRASSLDRSPLHGNEEEEFHRRYADVLRQREELRKEYD